MIEQMSNVFDQDRPLRLIKLDWVVHGSRVRGLRISWIDLKAFQGYWWYYFPWRFDSKFFHFPSRKPRWPHKMLVRYSHSWIFVRVQRTQISVRETLISIIVLVVFRTYDLKGNGFITREELFLLLRNTLTKFPSDEDTEEALRELVEISMKLMVRELVYVESLTP